MVNWFKQSVQVARITSTEERFWSGLVDNKYPAWFRQSTGHTYTHRGSMCVIPLGRKKANTRSRMTLEWKNIFTNGCWYHFGKLKMADLPNSHFPLVQIKGTTPFYFTLLRCTTRCQEVLWSCQIGHYCPSWLGMEEMAEDAIRSIEI